jgi:hypothetical protein
VEDARRLRGGHQRAKHDERRQDRCASHAGGAAANDHYITADAYSKLSSVRL